jgi:hypothetical protein
LYPDEVRGSFNSEARSEGARDSRFFNAEAVSVPGAFKVLKPKTLPPSGKTGHRY